MSETRIKILKNKIFALNRALDTNDYEFILKWHGSRKHAEEDLLKLKQRLEQDLE